MEYTEKRITLSYSPRKIFLPLHNRTERFAATVAHRRAGKTVAEVNDKIRAAITCKLSNPRVAYIAPFYKQAKAVAWTYAKQYGLEVPGAAVNESELRIDFPNGGQFRLYGADNPDALRGIYLDDVTLDEPADMNPRLWPEVIRPALVDRNGRASFIGTPKGRNGFYDICQHAKTSDDWLYQCFKASETGIVPAHEIMALRGMMTEDQFLQEFECSFDAAILGAYYGKEFIRAEDEGRVAEVHYDTAVKVYTAWDLGFTDDTAIWFFQVIGGEIHIIDYYYASGQPIEHYAQVIINRGYDYRTHYLPHDAKAKTLASGGRSVQEQLESALGVANIWIVPRLSLEDGIQAVRMAFPRMYFDASRCHEGIECLKQYQREWDDDRKCFRDKPRHDFTSHPADAFRYLALAWQEQAKPEITVRFRDGYDTDDEDEDGWKTA